MQATINPNVLNPLEGKMDQVIDIFVTFFGEKYREQIEHNLKSTIYCFIPKKIERGTIRNISKNKVMENYAFGNNYNLDKSKFKLNADCYDYIENEINKLYGISTEEFFKQKYSEHMLFLLKNLMKFSKNKDEKTRLKSYYSRKDVLGYPDIKTYEHLMGLDEEDIGLSNQLSTGTKTKFVQFFKKLGYDFGDRYEDYITNSEIRKKFFNKKNIKNFQESYKIVLNELCENYPSIKESLDEIKKSDLLYKNYHTTGIFNFAQASGDTCGFIRQGVTTNKEMKNVFCCPWGLSCEDGILLHELGHIVESSLLTHSNPNCVILKSGLTSAVYNIASENENVSRTEGSKILNEIIHDYFMSNDVIKIAENKGYKFTLSENEPSSYANAFVLMERIIEKHREKLKESLMEPNFDFVDYFGEENLNTICNALVPFYNKSIGLIKAKEFNSFMKDLKEYIYSNYRESEIPKMEEIYDYDKFLKSQGVSIIEIVGLNKDWSEGSMEYVKYFKDIYEAEENIDKRIREQFQRQ